jgi:hypothetical protein
MSRSGRSRTALQPARPRPRTPVRNEPVAQGSRRSRAA